MSSWSFTPSNRSSWNRWFPATKYDKYKFWSFAFSTQGTHICTSCLTIYNWPLDVSFHVSGSVPLMRSCRLDGPQVGWKQRSCPNTLISGHLLLLTISVICLLNQLQPTLDCLAFGCRKACLACRAILSEDYKDWTHQRSGWEWQKMPTQQR